jgi:hypothetical protein
MCNLDLNYRSLCCRCLHCVVDYLAGILASLLWNPKTCEDIQSNDYFSVHSNWDFILNLPTNVAQSSVLTYSQPNSVSSHPNSVYIQPSSRLDEFNKLSKWWSRFLWWASLPPKQFSFNLRSCHYGSSNVNKLPRDRLYSQPDDVWVRKTNSDFRHQIYYWLAKPSSILERLLGIIHYLL